MFNLKPIHRLPLILLVICLIPLTTIQSQTIQTITDDVIGGARYTIKDRGNQTLLLTAGVLAGLAFLQDREISDALVEDKYLPASVNDFGNWYGGLTAKLIFIPAIGGMSYFSDESLQQFGRRLGTAYTALGLSALATHGLKIVVGRERPDGSNQRSFPSGHTSSSFTVAAVLQEFYGPEIGIPAYLLAATSGLARIQSRHHYLSDVIFGAALGIVFGRGLVQWRRVNDHLQGHILSVNPFQRVLRLTIPL